MYGEMTPSAGKRPREILFGAPDRGENRMNMPQMPSKMTVKSGLELVAAIFAAMKARGLVSAESEREADMGITVIEAMLGVGSTQSELYAANATEFAHPLVSLPPSHAPEVVSEWAATHPPVERPSLPPG